MTEHYPKEYLDEVHSNIKKDIGKVEEDISELKGMIKEGFKVTHEKQDYTNGKVKKNIQDISKIRLWLLIGGTIIVTALALERSELLGVIKLLF
jgi:hypothetical protein